MAVIYPQPGANPDVNWQTLETALAASNPALDFAFSCNDQNRKNVVTDVYLWPQEGSGDFWGRRRSHIHLICSAPANGNARDFIKPVSATCTFRRYEGYTEKNGRDWQIRFPTGDYPKIAPQTGVWGLKGVLTVKVDDGKGNSITRFENVCRWWREDAVAPSAEKEKWSVAWTKSDAGGQAFLREWKGLLDGFQAVCDQVMGQQGWNLRY